MKYERGAFGDSDSSGEWLMKEPPLQKVMVLPYLGPAKWDTV
jgi:hypothetical protein